MKKTVLTIDDNGPIRRLIRMALEFKGFHVLEAADGVTGFAMALEHRPTLILLDVMMPGVSGLTVSAQLSSHPELSHIPVVMLSALGTAQDISAGVSTGARAYLVKPFSPIELTHLVGRLIDALP